MKNAIKMDITFNYFMLFAVVITMTVSSLYVFGTIFLSSSLPRPYVYEYLANNLKAECHITKEQEGRGVHVAYVYTYGRVEHVLMWYQQTRKECGIV